MTDRMLNHKRDEHARILRELADIVDAGGLRPVVDEQGDTEASSSISVERGRVFHIQADSIVIDGLKHSGAADEEDSQKPDMDKTEE